MSDCPCPHKVKHPTRWHAENALVSNWKHGRGKHLPIRSYLCQCGSWHLTSKEYNPGGQA